MKQVIYWAVALVLAWGLACWVAPNEDDEKPTAPATRSLFYLLAVGMWVGAAVSLFSLTGNNWFGNLVLAVCLGIGGKKAYQAGTEAYASKADDIEQATKIKVNERYFHNEVVRGREKEREAQLELELVNLRHETEFKREYTTQKEIELLDQLLEIGKERGITAVAVSAVNEHKYRTDIDLEKRWKEITQDLDAGDLLDLSDQQLIKKQTERLEEMYRRRYEIATGNDPQEVKESLLARYDKNIRHLEVKIDARQAGLLLSENEKETLRIGEGEAESIGYSEPEADAVQIEIPAPRRRGRPRKNPA
jgi:hypothetical protein